MNGIARPVLNSAGLMLLIQAATSAANATSMTIFAEAGSPCWLARVTFK